MNQDIDFRFDDGGLRRLLSLLESPHHVKVGLFGGGARFAAINRASKPGRIGGAKQESATNAEIGFVNEFGSPTKKIPARSWLRMPIMQKINNIMSDSRSALEEAVASGNAHHFFDSLGVAAEAWIQKAFDSSGFGSWAKNADSTIRRKKSASPLIDTGQLRRAVAHEVE